MICRFSTKHRTKNICNIFKCKFHYSKLFPEKVTVIEVGPRDGLQNEKAFVQSKDKIELVRLLSDADLKSIEVTSFVSPKAIAQFKDASYVFRNIHKRPCCDYSALVPNLTGLEAAKKAKVKSIAVFIAASDDFSLKNIRCTIEESLEKASDVIREAKLNGMSIRGYVSCIIECPYKGRTDPALVNQLTKALIEMGCHQVSLGDTIGVGTNKSVSDLLSLITKEVAPEKLAVHFHDTYGQALTNVYASLKFGISCIDSSIAGLGGCPFAKGQATGNLATEDLVYMLNGMGISTGVDLDKLLEATKFVQTIMPEFRVKSDAAIALMNKKK